jgi:hypothetical protein
MGTSWNKLVIAVINLILIWGDHEMLERELTIKGILKGYDFPKKAVYYYAYDEEQKILHLRDRDNHEGDSLINSINSNMRDRVLKKIESEESIKINLDSLRCFIYTDGDDDGLFGNEVDEYIFSLENTGENPFRRVKRTDSNLRYWY